MTPPWHPKFELLCSNIALWTINLVIYSPSVLSPGPHQMLSGLVFLHQLGPTCHLLGSNVPENIRSNPNTVKSSLLSSSFSSSSSSFSSSSSSSSLSSSSSSSSSSSLSSSSSSSVCLQRPIAQYVMGGGWELYKQ